MSRHSIAPVAFALVTVLTGTACARDDAGRSGAITAPEFAAPGTDNDNRVAFTHAPIAVADIAAVLPLGTLGEGSSLPSADATIVPNRNAVAVVAMASGLVTGLEASRGCLTMRMHHDVVVRYCGLSPHHAIGIGATLRAGQQIGVFDKVRSPAGLSVRVLDRKVNHLGWIRPERYAGLRHASFFPRYLPSDLRSALLALVDRAAPDLDGRIDYDRADRLVGTWFTQPLPDPPVAALGAGQPLWDVDPSPSIAPHALTLAYDAQRPGQVRIAVGAALADALGLRGVYGVAWEDADPASVNRESGIVRYTLYPANDETRSGDCAGTLLVHILDATTVRVEVIQPRTAGSAGFSTRSITLMR